MATKQQQPKPTTIAEVLDILLQGSKGERGGRKGWDEMTPTRFGHAAELLDGRVDPDLVQGLPGV